MVWLSRRLQPLSMVWLLASAEVFSTAKRIELELSAGFNPGPTLQGEEQVRAAFLLCNHVIWTVSGRCRSRATIPVEYLTFHSLDLVP
jgi:hypothetical protein